MSASKGPAVASMISGGVPRKSTPVLLGLLSSLFFSTTFVINRAIGLAGGHWVWTAVLRYAWVLVFMGAFLRWWIGAGRIRTFIRVSNSHSRATAPDPPD